MVAIKFCGLTRPEDAREAAALGASYVGVIFAGGPRLLSVERAAEVLRDVPANVRRVGVFSGQSDDEILNTVRAVGLSVVQLHGEQDPARVLRLGSALNASAPGLEVWPVLRVAGATLPANARELAMAADTFVLDTLAQDGLGGSGKTFAWDAVGGLLREMRRGRRIVLAGGLRPENVAVAIQMLRPDVVDVASGVEASTGIKDHQLMRAFRDAAQEVGATAHA